MKLGSIPKCLDDAGFSEPDQFRVLWIFLGQFVEKETLDHRGMVISPPGPFAIADLP